MNDKTPNDPDTPFDQTRRFDLPGEEQDPDASGLDETQHLDTQHLKESSMDQRLLGGRYELGELLGRGGMAEVHDGRDTRLGRTSPSRCCAATSPVTRRSRAASGARRSPRRR